MVSTDTEHLHLIIKERSIQLYPDVLIQKSLQENLRVQFCKWNIYFFFGVFMKVKESVVQESSYTETDFWESSECTQISLIEIKDFS